MKQSESLSKIAAALLEAQKNMGMAVKAAKNPFFKSKFADLNSVREAVMPALNESGISVLQLMVNEDGRNFVRTTLMHNSGEFISSDTEVVVAKASDPQALGSAISYARRYGLQAMLCVGAEDDDGERAMSRASSEDASPKAQPAAVATTSASTEQSKTTRSSFKNSNKAKKTDEVAESVPSSDEGEW